MIEGVLKRIACIAGRHERCPERARADDAGTYYSVCVHCSVPMRRVRKRTWVVAKR